MRRQPGHSQTDFLFAELTDETAAALNLWLVIAGRHMPLRDELDQFRPLMTGREIEPFSEQAIRLVWEGKRGLDPAEIPNVIRLGGKKPEILFWMANEFTMNLQGEKAL